MTSYRYLHLDVFTDRRFTGNQLAVFPDARGLDTATQQQMACEMGFSESTFVFDPEVPGTDARMRIFTPAEEMPMAGHPTIGSAFALAHLGAIQPGRARFVFGLNVGPTPVDLEWNGDQLAFAWMTQQLPQFGPTLADRSGVAAALGLQADDLGPDLPPPQVVSCGVPFAIVPVRSREAVDRAVADLRAMARLWSALALEQLPFFFFALDAMGAVPTAYSRMFAPGLGVAEDPATGSASGPLGCYLVRHRLVSPDHARNIVSHQGVAMGRPSRIHVEIDAEGDAVRRVRVGGTSVLAGEGTLVVDA